MTNTKFRKRALLSSVAMLLVALVALGSATFAWFVANPTVTASGLDMKALAAPGLNIASSSDYFKSNATAGSRTYQWGNTANLAGDAFTLDPASPVAGTAPTAIDSLAFAYIQALADNDEAADTTNDTLHATTPVTVTDWNGTSFTYGSGKVYYEDLYFKKSSEGSGDVQIKGVSVKIDSANNDIAKGVKVAVVAQKPGASTASYELLGIWKATDGDDSRYAAGTTGTTFTTPDTGYYKANQATVNTTINVDGSSTPGANTAQLRVFVYLDGENQYTYSTNATTLTDLLGSKGIKVRVSTAEGNIAWTSAD